MKTTKRLPLLSGLTVAILAGLVTSRAQITNLDFLTNGLVAYYPFNGTANDANGNGNDGLALGAVPTADRFGRAASAYQFNGTNSYVLIPPYPAFNAISNTLSISLWIRLNGGLAWPRAYEADLLTRGYECSLGLYNNRPAATPPTNLLFFPTLGVAVTSHPLAVGRDYHIVATANKGVSAVFLDGALVSKSTFASFPFNQSKTAPITIGASVTELGVPNYPFNGVIDDLRIYNRALSTNEVAQLHSLESVSGFAPSLSIQVKTIRVNLLVQPGGKYQLETSSDLAHWTTFGLPFIAPSAALFQDVEVLGGAQYFRITGVPWP